MKNNVNKTTNNTTTKATKATTGIDSINKTIPLPYEEVLKTARRLIKDGLTVKDAVNGIRYSTAAYAIEFCRNFKSWSSYKNLFEQLKEDLKKEGVKFAGTPLAKACLAVSTAVIDCRLQIEGESIEDRLTFTRSAFKDAGVNFSAKQSDIRLGFGCPTKSDKESAEEAAFAEVKKCVEGIQKGGIDAVRIAIQCLTAWIEKESKISEKAEEIAKSKAA